MTTVFESGAPGMNVAEVLILVSVTIGVQGLVCVIVGMAMAILGGDAP